MAVEAVSAHHIPSPAVNYGAAAISSSNNLSNSGEFYRQTKEIVHECLHNLLMEQGIRTNGYTTGVMVEPKFSSEVNRRAYLSLISACKQFFQQNTDVMRKTIEKIDLSDTTLCTTFHKTMYSMFDDDVTWGRIVALLCFSAFLAAKAHRNGKAIIIDSIEGWVVTFICTNLQSFIVKSKGWASVPDRFNPEKLSSRSSSWLTLAAVGLGAALVTAFLT